MAPHCTLALLLAISVLLGIGRAMNTCETEGSYQCVDSNKCEPGLDWRSNRPRCRNNQVCCALENIKEDQPCPGTEVCVHQDLCRPGIASRSAGQCSEPNHVCCVVEAANDLSIKEPLD